MVVATSAMSAAAYAFSAIPPEPFLPMEVARGLPL